MSAALVVDWGGSKWGLIHYRKTSDPLVRCFSCGKLIGRGGAHYRCRSWGADHDETAYAHQRCLVGQIDPTVWDID